MTDEGTVPFEELCANFIRLKAEKDDLDARAKQIEREMDALREPIIRRMQQTGVTKMSAAGRTLYLRRDLWASVKDRPAAIAALREAGLDQYVYETFSSQSLSAWMRQLPEDPVTGLPAIPPELAGKIEAVERWDVRVVRS